MKKYRTEAIIIFVLIVLFFISRLVSLVKLPIFVDEAIYLRWAQIAKNDANWRFISLTDGKQPLFVWLTAAAMKFAADPLVAGRLVSVFVGLASMGAIWGLTYILFKSKRLAFLSSLAYLVSPFSLVYDRMALMDGLLAFFSLLSLSLAIILVRTLRLDIALLLGFSLAGGILTKSSGFLSIYFLPLTLLLFDWSSKKRWKKLLQWLGLVLVAIIVSQMLYSVLRLSPLFYMIKRKDAAFIFPFEEWLKHPFYHLIGNLRGLLDWLVTYLTWPWIGLIGLALVFIKKQSLEKILLFLWFLAPFSALALFAHTLYPRFIFFMSLPLFILVAWAWEEILQKLKNNKWVFTLVLCLFLAWPLITDFNLLTEPVKAKIARSDWDQYIRSWPAGYGVNEIVAVMKEEARSQKIFLATEGTFGLMPASFELYLWDHPNVKIKGYFPVNVIPDDVLAQAKKTPTFFVFNETKQVPGHWPLELVAEYPRPQEQYSMRLYQVLNR